MSHLLCKSLDDFSSTARTIRGDYHHAYIVRQLGRGEAATTRGDNEDRIAAQVIPKVNAVMGAVAAGIANSVPDAKMPVWQSDMYNNINQWLNGIPEGARQMWINSSSQTQIMIRASVIGAVGATVSTLMYCIKHEKTVSESITLITAIGGAAAVLGPILAWSAQQIGPLLCGGDSIRSCLLAVGVEVTREGVEQMVAGMVGAGLGVLIDIIAHLGQVGFPRTSRGLWDFVVTIGDAIVANSALGTTAAVLGYFLPSLATVILMGIIGFCMSELRQHLRDTGKTTLSGAIGRGVLFIPVVLWRTFVPAGTPPPIDPPDLSDDILATPLTEPVFFKGYVVNRQTALQQLTARGVDFHNVLSTEDDIVPMPELKELVVHYERIRLHL